MLVDRPSLEPTAARFSTYPYAAVRATLDTQKAHAQTTQSRAEARRMVEAMRRVFRAEGLRLARQYTATGVVLWVVRWPAP